MSNFDANTRQSSDLSLSKDSDIYATIRPGNNAAIDSIDYWGHKLQNLTDYHYHHYMYLNLKSKEGMSFLT